MLPRERIEAAIDFRPVDVVPLRVFAAPGGLHEHGQKLLDLAKECGDDFGSSENLALPAPPGPEDFDPDGRYHAVKTDEWGVTWEYRIFGVWGHPLSRPLDDISRLAQWQPPAAPALSGPDFESARAETQRLRKRFYTVAGWASIFEPMHCVRRFEDVLMDVALDTPEINRLADMLTAYSVAGTDYALALGADAIRIGDDYGTQEAMMLSPDVFRRFFMPRYQSIIAPAARAGKKTFFHTCGAVGEILRRFQGNGRRRPLAAAHRL